MSYEETLADLQSLQKQFRRMEFARQQRVNARHIQRAKNMRIEAMSQVHAQKLNSAKSRKTLLEEEKERETKLNADRRERRRKSRLRMVSKFGFHGLATGNHISTMVKQRNDRQKKALARKAQLDAQKEFQMRDKFEKREKQRQEQTKRKKNRPHSAPLSKILQQSKDNLPFNSNLSPKNKTSPNDYVIFQDKSPEKPLKKQQSKEITSKNIDKSKRPISAVRNKNRRPLGTLNKNQVYHFMKPTLANYLGDQNCVQVLHLNV